MRKRIIAITLTFVFLIIFISVEGGSAFAHDYMLNVEYDACVATVDGDGVDEMWYKLDSSSVCKHLSHEVLTVRYYFINSLDGDDIQDIPIDSIKEAYANSMKKWDSVYFYSYDEAGNVVKNKLVNVVEGTEENANLPIYLVSELSHPAVTNNFVGEIIESGEITHRHDSDWFMEVRVGDLYVHGSKTVAEVNCHRERLGAHELGHVLGLRDIESCCGASDNGTHHHELLMGAGSIQSRAKDITYKDIVGVAITRGFHTDNDHKWLNYGVQSDGTCKVICSICNGVKYVEPLSAIKYDTYGKCDNKHNLSDGNMMAVASYRTKDYYKCKYCRYVAPFEDIVDQDYTVTSLDNFYHQYENNVFGLDYSFNESHKADRYVYLNNNSHRGTCVCGKVLLAVHYVLYEEIENGRYVNCIGCRARLDLTQDKANISYGIATMRTANGSYILPNGIVVLMVADVEAYMDGTLQFYNNNDQTLTK